MNVHRCLIFTLCSYIFYLLYIFILYAFIFILLLCLVFALQALEISLYVSIAWG